MAKYGDGLNKEIVKAVNSGLIPKIFDRDDIKKFIKSKNWNVPEKSISVCLSNGAAQKHSMTYGKYFKALGDGKYSLSDDDRISILNMGSSTIGKTRLTIPHNSQINRLILRDTGPTTSSSVSYTFMNNFAMAPTDEEWFLFLKEHTYLEKVNFWTPTPWNVKGLQQGQRLYFMLKAPIRKIGGYGEFIKYENLTKTAAWSMYGLGNGVRSLDELNSRAMKYTNLRSNKDIANESEIGCILLRNAVFFEEDQYITAEDLGISFPNQVVKIKYFSVNEFPAIHNQTNVGLINKFALVEDGKLPKKQREINQRTGQPGFRKMLLEAYEGCCAISGEKCVELLEAAHIQPYQNEKSNHVQNGLLLRVDLHRLFDAGLITVDTEYRIKLSPKFTSEEYKKFDNKRMKLPKSKEHAPAKEALSYHFSKRFRQ